MNERTRIERRQSQGNSTCVMHNAGNVGGEEEELCWVCAMTNGFILQAEAPNMQVNEHKVFSFERIFLSASEKLDLQILRLTK